MGDAKGGRSNTARTGHEGGHLDLHGVVLSRALFWENVVREMLTGFSILQQSQPQLFDGRYAVLTRDGQRVPIAEVSPLLACSIPGTPGERESSVAVQCTVFRIVTPSGEVFTLPVSEVRAVHALTPALVEQLQKAAEGQDEEEDADARPFGLAAFAALPKQQAAE